MLNGKVGYKFRKLATLLKSFGSIISINSGLIFKIIAADVYLYILYLYCEAQVTSLVNLGLVKVTLWSL